MSLRNTQPCELFSSFKSFNYGIVVKTLQHPHLSIMNELAAYVLKGNTIEVFCKLNCLKFK